jgi:CubicO group peptidase (beta-lactamase class C family)
MKSQYGLENKMKIKKIIKKKKVSIPIIVVSVFLLTLISLDYFLIMHQLPEAGEEFALSDSVKAVIRDNVNNGKHQSLFVGIIDENDVEYYYYGDIAKGENPIDENTLFEIGSVTKVFTTMILADMVEKGEVNLNDPIEKFLPEDVSTPSKNGMTITLFDLATHSSGLPRMPDGFPITDMDEQFQYDREEMYDSLSKVELSREIGSQYEYSNFGFSLLGHILSLQAGQSYEELLQKRVLDKFGMDSTCVKQCDDFRDRFANPHFLGFAANELNLSEDMVGAGEIRSSGKDMLSFLSYVMGLEDSDLKDSFQLTQKVNRQIDDTLSIGLAWHMLQKDDRMIVWHNGATNGFASFVGFDPESNQGVVVLTNTLNPVDDIGVWLLEHGHVP